MLVDAGYYSYDIATSSDSDDTLFRQLVRDGVLKVVRETSYQSAERAWILAYAPTPFELDAIDSFKWLALMRTASSSSKPEDTIPADELNMSGHPIADALEDGVLVPVQEAKDAAKSVLKSNLPFIIGGAVLLLFLLRPRDR